MARNGGAGFDSLLVAREPEVEDLCGCWWWTAACCQIPTSVWQTLLERKMLACLATMKGRTKKFRSSRATWTTRKLMLFHREEDDCGGENTWWGVEAPMMTTTFWKLVYRCFDELWTERCFLCHQHLLPWNCPWMMTPTEVSRRDCYPW